MKSSFKEIFIEDLPKYSDWPYRIVGLSDWNLSSGKRTKKHIQKEYGQKWEKINNLINKNKNKTLEPFLHCAFRNHFPSNLLIHINEKFFYVRTNKMLWDYIYKIIAEHIDPYIPKNKTIVELGAGWGRNLFRFFSDGIADRIVGAEFTKEGVAAGRKIAEKYNVPGAFYHFDYNNPNKKLLPELKDTVVFTHNSIEQIPCLKSAFIEFLIQAKPAVIIHFEPVYEYRTKNTLHHLLWKRYTELNDYNRNLLTLLKEMEKRKKIKIVKEEPHLLGLNAFNPGSFIIWKTLK